MAVALLGAQYARFSARQHLLSALYTIARLSVCHTGGSVKMVG